jgi:DNA-binding transcriptional LysR family regulator
LPLLSLSGVGEWFSWDGWFRQFEIVPPDRLVKTSFNTYDLVMQAALDGHGVALGWHGLVDQMLDRGDLVRAVPDMAESDRGYFLRLGRTPAGEAARRVHDWMADVAGI